jgi:protein SCO1/2
MRAIPTLPPPFLSPSVITAVKLLLWALALAALPPSLARAHDPQDLVFDKVGVDERLGKPIPTELSFTDQSGQPVQLSRYFTGGPVILTLNYYSCPTLCPLVFRNMVDTIGKMGNFRLGKDFRIVTVSIDPEETLQRAADKSAKTYAMLGTPPGVGAAWPFLMGSRASIERLAQSVGVRYSRQGDHDFAHPNVIVIVTPDGRVSRYLYGLEQAPQDLKLALMEATDGRIGSSVLVNRALLYCFHYDPVGKKYVLVASRIMTGAMLGVLVLTAALLALLWKREKPAS